MRPICCLDRRELGLRRGENVSPIRAGFAHEPAEESDEDDDNYEDTAEAESELSSEDQEVASHLKRYCSTSSPN